MTPHRRLARFMRLLAHLQTAPWAAMEFSVNTTILRRLTAAHVHLIAPGGDLSSGDPGLDIGKRHDWILIVG